MEPALTLQILQPLRHAAFIHQHELIVDHLDSVGGFIGDACCRWSFRPACIVQLSIAGLANTMMFLEVHVKALRGSWNAFILVPISTAKVQGRLQAQTSTTWTSTFCQWCHGQ